MSKVSDADIRARTSDIHVHFVRLGLTHIHGTWQQLQDEGFVPRTESMPPGNYLQLRLNDCATLSAQRKWVPGTRGKGKVGVKLRDSDWWCITIDHDHFSLEEDELYRHREKVRREIRALSPEGKKERHRTVSMAARAYSDSAFQQFKRRLLLQAKGAVQHG
ncbi:hypothetical protein ACFJGX_11065 [Hydrogenophaga sp. UC242_50]|uniref:hypothetical protein n=1 Tax=unclassified Hydrogenophaga TaxID=2610897 RepID=UPI0036D269BF